MSDQLMDSYYKRWLARARKKLAVGEHTLELTHQLAAIEGVRAEEMRTEIQRVLGGYETPTTEFVSRVENYLNSLSETPTPELVQAG